MTRPDRPTRTADGGKGGPALGRAPLPLLIPAILACTFLVLPLVTLVAATPWSRFGELMVDPAVGDALTITTLTSLTTVVLCVLLGTPLAWTLARIDFPGRSLMRALVTVPLVLPPVVAGVALLTAAGRSSLLGGVLRDLSGFTLPYTTAAVIIAHTFVSLPFYVLAVEGALRTSGEAYDVVAATLGADRWTTFRRVTLPLAMPGLFAGAVLAWARSLGEFGATITFAGNYPGTTQTMPTLIFQQLQADPDIARVLSLILLVVSLSILAALRGRWLVRP